MMKNPPDAVRVSLSHHAEWAPTEMGVTMSSELDPHRKAGKARRDRIHRPHASYQRIHDQQGQQYGALFNEGVTSTYLWIVIRRYSLPTAVIRMAGASEQRHESSLSSGYYIMQGEQ